MDIAITSKGKRWKFSIIVQIIGYNYRNPDAMEKLNNILLM